MLHTSLENMNNNLSSMLYHTLESHEEVSIATSKGAVIMLSQEDYNSMQETLRLLNDKKSLSALLDSHRARDEDKLPRSYAISEVFNDIQN